LPSPSIIGMACAISVRAKGTAAPASCTSMALPPGMMALVTPSWSHSPNHDILHGNCLHNTASWPFSFDARINFLESQTNIELTTSCLVLLQEAGQASTHMRMLLGLLWLWATQGSIWSLLLTPCAHGCPGTVEPPGKTWPPMLYVPAIKYPVCVPHVVTTSHGPQPPSQAPDPVATLAVVVSM